MDGLFSVDVLADVFVQEAEDAANRRAQEAEQNAIQRAQEAEDAANRRAQEEEAEEEEEEEEEEKKEEEDAANLPATQNFVCFVEFHFLFLDVHFYI